jgi:hypothetical protein
MWAFCLVPTIWFALFGLLVLRAALAVGEWPTYGNPDPKDLALPLHHTFTIIVFLASFVVPFGIALVFALRRPLDLHGARLPVIIFLVTFLGMVLFLRTPLGSALGMWWMD